MQSISPLVRDVVMVGGGHTHALVLHSFAMSPVAGARLTVINPGPTAPYSGMLPGHVAGHYTRDDLDINLVRLCRMAGARFISGKADGLDLMNKTVSVPGRPPVPYDLASLDIGITSEMPKLPGFIKHAHPAKPLGPFARDWEVFVADDGPKTVAVIGAGVAGCELAMAMAYRLQGQPAEITLIEAGDEILRDTLPRTRARLRHHLDRLGITLRTGAGASEVTADGVHLSNGGFVDARYVTGAAATRPQTWLERTHLELHDGFIKVRPDLRSSDPSVYAVGDCAHLTDNPRPKAGVYAVRQAPFLFANLRADLTGRARRPYRPQPGYLKLISVGDKIAVADKFGITIEGKHWWALKDRIDAKFMGQFKKLKPMSLPAPSGDVSRGVADLLAKGPDCSGCGAKVAALTLNRALEALPKAQHPDTLRGAGDDAALLRRGEQVQAFTTDHLNSFWADPYLFARIAAVHALGDVWAMGAAPQAVLLTAILPKAEEVLQERMLTEVIAGVSAVVAEARADIVGGHTSTGVDLSIGLSVTGLANAPVQTKGAQPGDVLILTKPLGSGTLLAAEMRGKARGADVLVALNEMARPLSKDSAVLAPVANAMTDVTGFGLAGHLATFGVAAEIELEALPIYSGAEDLAARGVRSSLYEANLASAPVKAPDSPGAALLHDPQTAGGLLAAVPAGHVAEVLEKLPHAHQIGRVVEGPANIVAV